MQMGRIAVLVSAVLLSISAQAFAVPPEPKVVKAADGIFAAFQTHPLVGLLNNEGTDNHDLAQQEDFYAALVRDPRFARDVGNVVVEFGAASAQKTIDRYVDGEDVPYVELRKVWTDTVGWAPPPFDLGYVNLFAQIRATNLALPPAQRIHVWLGEPPVDWSKIKKMTDIAPTGAGVMQLRDNHAADVIERDVLGRGRKALVIYGGFHFLTDPVLLAPLPGYSSMAVLVERLHPGVFFKIFTYAGFPDAACTAQFEKDNKKLVAPALLTPLHGTTLDDLAFRRKCLLRPLRFPPDMPAAKKTEITDHAMRWNADAMLYLGPAASLTGSPLLPDIYLDTAYQKEVMRRMGKKITPSRLGVTVDKNPAAPGPYKN